MLLQMVQEFVFLMNLYLFLLNSIFEKEMFQLSTKTRLIYIFKIMVYNKDHFNQLANHYEY